MMQIKDGNDGDIKPDQLGEDRKRMKGFWRLYHKIQELIELLKELC